MKSSIQSVAEKEPIENTACLKIGRSLEVSNTNESLILYDYKDALAGDGLYYAFWHIGDAMPCENSDSDTVDLYDAQLYLLLGEFASAEKTQENETEWPEREKTPPIPAAYPLLASAVAAQYASN